MELIKPFLIQLLKDSASGSKFFKRNLLKNYLQILVLDFIYSHQKYSRLIFYGGSCLSHCHNLPRLSEDLDFVDLEEKINILELAKDLEEYFKKNTDLGVKAMPQKFRVYLKFSLLHELELAVKSESDLLFLKVEIFKGFDFCKGYKIEIIPVFRFGKSVLIKTLDLPSLMSTKIRAILYRKWEKTTKDGRILARVKGRDYFDLLWYWEKGARPNLDCLGAKFTKNKLKKTLLRIIKTIDNKSISFDLESLIEDKVFIKNLAKNIKDILIREINHKL